MSNTAEERIAFLERELRVAQEILFLVLDTIDEPVRFDLDEAKERMASDRVIDLTLDSETNEWVAQVVSLPSE